MPTGPNIATLLQRWTYLVPLAIAVLVGLVTWQHWTYFIVMALLAFGPAVFGMPDPVGELVDLVGRERKRRDERRHRRGIVERHSITFLRQLREQDARELRLMAQCILGGRQGFNRDNDDPATLTLLERGLVYAEPGFTPAGFPFYFTDRAWVLMNELRDEIFAAHDRVATPPVTPPPAPRVYFSPARLAADLLVLSVRGPLYLVVALTGAGVVWAVWLAVMAAIVFVLVSAGYGVRWLLGF